MNTLKNLSNKLAAVATVGLVLGTSSFASANTFADSVTNTTATTTAMPQLIGNAAYIGGLAFGIAGVIKLKAHVDNPGQNGLKDGLIRLGIGGALVAFPALTEAMVDLAGNGGGTIATVTVPNAP